jgi:hypothetical protein
LVFVSTEERLAEPPSMGRGCLAAWALVVLVAIAAIPIASHWNARGGEEWWTGLVLGSAGLAVLGGLLSFPFQRRRVWAVGLIVGALLGLVTVFGGFLIYFVPQGS